MSRREHFDNGHGKAQFNQARGWDYEGDDEGPYCNNCSDDMEEVMEWHDRDKNLHPAKRVPCKGCGAI